MALRDIVGAMHGAQTKQEIQVVKKKPKKERFRVEPREHRSKCRSSTIRTEVWTTLNGREIPVHTMSDLHLQNTVRYLLRTIPDRFKHDYFAMQEIIAEAPTKELHEAYRAWLIRNWPRLIPEIILTMVEEIEDRGLVVEMEGDAYGHVTQDVLTAIFGGKLTS